MNTTPQQLTDKENEFVAETITKELFFALHSEGPTPFTKMIAELVEWERGKLENEEIGSDDYEKDIRTATAILQKLNFEEEA